MPGAQCTRSRAWCVVNTRVSHREVTGKSPGIPARNGFTAYFVLSPVIGLSCHRRLACLPAKLDAGVEASGPHDFAVAFCAFRQARIRVHRIPPRVDDVAQRPSFGPGQAD